MQNFAQEFPFLLFLPAVIFAGLAVLVGIIHLAVLFETRIESQRRIAALAARNLLAAARPQDPQLFPTLSVSRRRLTLISTKV